MRPRTGLAAALCAAALALAARARALPAREVYQQICATCHGSDGRGEPGARLFGRPMPDFSDCAFSRREADVDWLAVVHAGGPARGMSVVMPAFGDSFDPQALAELLVHLRSFCRDERWPRGELNLPRPLVTEKAFPEDEALVSADVALEGGTAASAELVFEKRIGARHQVEIALPIELAEKPGNGHVGTGIGDLALAAKTTVFDDLARGSIFSLGSELLLPTGDEDRGRGSGTVVFEPFACFGQIVAGDGSLQLQLAGELPADSDHGDPELLARSALGWTFAQGRFGRTFTPMLEVLGTFVFDGGDPADEWDLVPQLQVSLSRRQHVLLSAGARVPVGDGGERDVRFLAYLLWDWFDGGLLEGW